MCLDVEDDSWQMYQQNSVDVHGKCSLYGMVIRQGAGEKAR